MDLILASEQMFRVSLKRIGANVLCQPQAKEAENLESGDLEYKKVLLEVLTGMGKKIVPNR